MKLRDDWKWIVAIAAVCLVVFANSLTGEFLYDDTRQILRNTLIQDNSLIWKALTSDVWAFKGDGTVAASNYWRPTFTAWHILNFRLFGLSPLGWHITNLLLHSGVSVLVFASLRRWGLSAILACAAALIFAVHPVHVESVAWISGSPDLLFSLAFLGSLWFARNYAENGKTNDLLLTIVLYAAALGAKEIGIVCLPIFYFVMSAAERSPKKKVDLKTALLILGGAAVGYFALRFAVIGALARTPDDPVSLGSALLSVPEMFAFYLRQLFFPYWLGVNYPVEPVIQIGAMNFVIPLIVSLGVLAGIWYLARDDARARIGAAMFLLPLATAMNATAFISEQIVHDRYLYLPLMGVTMLLIPLAAKFAGERNTLIAAAIIAAVLGFQTFRYNTAWANELSLWTWTSTIDNSSFTSMQKGAALAEAGKDNEAIASYTAAIDKKAAPRGYIGRGRSYLKLKQYKNAEADLLKAVGYPSDRIEAYALYQAYEALGLVYSETQSYEPAIRYFNEGRSKLPMYNAALTTNLAIVLYQNGQKDQALRELEGVKTQARKEMLPESKSAFLRLGMLYAELGRKDEARAALQEFMGFTAKTTDKIMLAERTQAAKLLETLR